MFEFLPVITLSRSLYKEWTQHSLLPAGGNAVTVRRVMETYGYQEQRSETAFSLNLVVPWLCEANKVHLDFFYRLLKAQ